MNVKKNYNFENIKDKYEVLYSSYQNQLIHIDNVFNQKNSKNAKDFNKELEKLNIIEGKNKSLTLNNINYKKKYLAELEKQNKEEIKNEEDRLNLKKEEISLILSNKKQETTIKKQDILDNYNKIVNDFIDVINNTITKSKEENFYFISNETQNEKIRISNINRRINEILDEIKAIKTNAEMTKKQINKKFHTYTSNCNQEIRDFQRTLLHYTNHEKNRLEKENMRIDQQILKINEELIDKQKAILNDFRNQLILADIENDFLNKWDFNVKKEINADLKTFYHEINYNRLQHENKLRKLSFDITKDYNINLLKKEYELKVKELEIKKQEIMYKSINENNIKKTNNLTSIWEIEQKLLIEEINKDELLALNEMKTNIKINELSINIDIANLEIEKISELTKHNIQTEKAKLEINNRLNETKIIMFSEEKKIKKNYELTLIDNEYEKTKIIYDNEIAQAINNLELKKIKLDYILKKAQIEYDFFVLSQQNESFFALDEKKYQERLLYLENIQIQSDESKMIVTEKFKASNQMIILFIDEVFQVQKTITKKIYNFTKNNHQIHDFINSAFVNKHQNIDYAQTVLKQFFNKQIESFLGIKYDLLKSENKELLDKENNLVKAKISNLNQEIEQHNNEISNLKTETYSILREISLNEGTINSIYRSLSLLKKQNIANRNTYQSLNFENKKLKKKNILLIKLLEEKNQLILLVNKKIEDNNRQIKNFNKVLNINSAKLNNQYKKIEKKEYIDTKIFYNMIKYADNFIKKMHIYYTICNEIWLKYPNKTKEEKTLHKMYSKSTKSVSKLKIRMNHFYLQLINKNNKTYNLGIKTNNRAKKTILNEIAKIKKIYRKKDLKINDEYIVKQNEILDTYESLLNNINQNIHNQTLVYEKKQRDLRSKSKLGLIQHKNDLKALEENHLYVGNFHVNMLDKEINQISNKYINKIKEINEVIHSFDSMIINQKNKEINEEINIKNTYLIKHKNNQAYSKKQISLIHKQTNKNHLINIHNEKELVYNLMELSLDYNDYIKQINNDFIHTNHSINKEISKKMQQEIKIIEKKYRPLINKNQG